MTRDERKEEVAELCATHNCTEKLRKIHYDQFVDRYWHPHPSEEFLEWFKTLEDFRLFNVNPKVAWNCQRYRDEFWEAKKYGIASP